MARARRFLCAVMAIVLCLTLFHPAAPAGRARAAVNYDRTAAVNYARSHWNDDKGQCAEFVSDCLNAGGIPVFNINVTYLLNALDAYGTRCHLQIGNDGRYYQADNAGIIEIGDPVYVYCNDCLDCSPPYCDRPRPHIGIVCGFGADGSVLFAAHNGEALDWPLHTLSAGHKVNDIPHTNTTIYVMHINTDGSYTPPSTDAVRFLSTFSTNVAQTTAHIEATITTSRRVFEVGAEYDTSSSFPNPRTVKDSNYPSMGTRIWYDFGSGYPALNPGTTYYYRFYYKETASDSRHYSSVNNLTTLPSPVNAAIEFNKTFSLNVTEYTGHIEANVSVRRNVFEVGAEYDTDSSFPNPKTVSDTNYPQIVDRIWYDFGNGEYPALNQGTTYYYRFYYMETASDSRHYSSVNNLTTLSLITDTTPPVVTGVTVSDISSAGYTVTCTVSDDTGVLRVAFPTWTLNCDQDDIVWADGVLNGSTATFRVNASEHYNETGTYRTDVYAYDTAGNPSILDSSAMVWVNVPKEPGKPSLGILTPNGVSPDSMHATTFFWAPTANTDWYDIRIYNEDASLVLYTGWNVLFEEFDALLPAGSYQADVASVYSDESEAVTFSDRISFTVEQASVSGSGELLAETVSGGSLYRLYRKNCTWLEAESLGWQQHGHLVTIESAAEQEVIASLLADHEDTYWLGAESYRCSNEVFANAEYCWLTGEIMTYTNWQSGQPDNAQGAEICACILPSGKWADTTCSGRGVHGYIVELEPVSLSCVLASDRFLANQLPSAEDLTVYAVFADGTMAEVQDFSLTYSGTDTGSQTMTLDWGGVTTEIPIIIYELMPEPDMVLPEGVTVIGDTAFASTGVRVFKCPEGLTEISHHTFINCPNLTDIYIPASVTFIGIRAIAKTVTIWGVPGSFAEFYANKNGYAFKAYYGD